MATTGDDEDNLVVAKLAKHEYRVGRVIARINNPKNEWLFTPRMGVDIAISHAGMLARLIHEELTLGDLIPLFKLAGGQVSLVELNRADITHDRTNDRQSPAQRMCAGNSNTCWHRSSRVAIPGSQPTTGSSPDLLDQQAELVTIFN